MAAVQKVLSIPELLENIITSLPIWNIIIATRVDSTWLELVTSSPNVQQILTTNAAKSPNGKDAAAAGSWCIVVRGRLPVRNSPVLLIRRLSNVEIVCVLFYDRNGDRVAKFVGRATEIRHMGFYIGYDLVWRCRIMESKAQDGGSRYVGSNHWIWCETSFQGLEYVSLFRSASCDPDLLAAAERRRIRMETEVKRLRG